MKIKYFFLKLSILLAFLFWTFESIIHYFILNEFEFEMIPSDSNEVWMRCIIIILVIIFGLFADYNMNKLIEKNAEKNEIYNTMLDAAQHILNNFLNQMTLFRMEAEDSKNFDKEILTLYDQVIENAIMQLKELENIQHPSQKSIEDIYKLK